MDWTIGESIVDLEWMAVASVWGIFAGAALGSWLEARIWRGKADDPMMMCSGGRFYQVLHESEYNKLCRMRDLARNYSDKVFFKEDFPFRDEVYIIMESKGLSYPEAVALAARNAGMEMPSAKPGDAPRRQVGPEERTDEATG